MTADQIFANLDANDMQDAPIVDIVDEIVELLPEPKDGCYDDWGGWQRAERLASAYVCR
jgi:hypothetical protein